MDVSGKDRAPMYMSIMVVVLTILAIIAFALSGGSIAFYTIALITIVVGFLMAYFISKPEKITRKQKRSK
jgi:4-hydroxybenzoate polyprenyltransferase